MQANVRISGFYDEVSSDLETQLKLMKKLGESYICPRGVNGRNISSYTAAEFERDIKPVLDSYGAKFSSKTMLTSVSVLGALLVVLAMLLPEVSVKMPAFDSKTFTFSLESVPVNVMLLMLCGLCTSVMWGSIFNLAVEGLGKYTSMASGIFMVMVCGGGVLPVIQGWIADKSNYIDSYWLIVACLLYLLFYALVGSKTVNRNIPVEG